MFKKRKGVSSLVHIQGIAYGGSPYKTDLDFQDWATKVINQSTLINDEGK